MRPQRSIRMPLRRSPQARPAPGTRKPKPAPKMRARATAADDDCEIEDYEAEAEPNMRFSHALFVVLILHVIAVGGVIAFNSIKSGQEKSAAAAAPATAPTPQAGSTAGAESAVRKHTVAEGDTLTRIAATYGTSIETLERANGLTAYSTLRIGQILDVPEPGQAPVTASSRPEPAVTKVSSTPIPSVPKTSQASADSASKEKFLATREQSAAPAKAAPSAALAKPAPVAPAVAAKTSAPAPVAAAETAVSSGDASATATYTVAKGDNPYSIAKKHGVSYKKLLEINNIEDPTKIQIGQVLKMPPAAP